MGEQLGLLPIVLEYRHAKHTPPPFAAPIPGTSAAYGTHGNKPVRPTFRTADYTTRKRPRYTNEGSHGTSETIGGLFAAMGR